MKLAELLSGGETLDLRADPALEVGEVEHDSRRLRAGALFVAIRGQAADGNRFVEAARRKGAVAVVSEEPPSPTRPGCRSRTRAWPWRAWRPTSTAGRPKSSSWSA